VSFLVASPDIDTNLSSLCTDDFFLGISFIYVIDVVVRFIGLGYFPFRANGWNFFDVLVAGGSFVTTLFVRFGNAGTHAYAVEQLQKLFLVSIAFKLVQRTNNLNKLFKTAMWVPSFSMKKRN
jgi:voltage-dependent calcium channel